MAPATSKPRVTNFTDIGVAGRKTGITVKDTGQRDAFGMEPITGFFSPSASPDKEDLTPAAKSSPAKIVSNQTISIEESMDIVTSEPTSRLNRASLPPRARSPIKTTLNSPARRASSVGFSSPVRRSPPAINRRLDFGFGSSTAIESSPALPPPLPPTEVPTRAKVNRFGSSLSPSTGEKEKVQKAKKAQLAQVVEEETSVIEVETSIIETSVIEPTPPAKKKKRGLLVQKKPAAGKKKAFSMVDVETDEEEEEDSVGEALDNLSAVEGETRDARDAFDEGLSQILDDSVMVGEDTDVVMSGVQQHESSEEEAQSAPQKGKAAKPTKVPPKKVTKAAEREKEKEIAQPAKAKVNGTKAKATKTKAPEPESEPEPEPESEPAPPVKARAAPKGKGKKAKPVEEPLDEEPESEPTPPTKAKAAPKSRGKKAKPAEDPMEEDTLEPVPPPPKGRGKKSKPAEEPREEETPPAPKPKTAPKGKAKSRAKAIQEEEEIPESEQEPEPESIEEDQEEEEPAKKRSRTAKDKPIPPPKKLSAKAKGKQPAVPKKASQKTKEASPELQSYAPSPAPKTKATKVAKAKAAAEVSSAESSSNPPAPSQAKKGGQRIIKQKPPLRQPSEDPDGVVRRSSRTRIEPLAFWKNEKIVYGLGARRKSGKNIAMPEIVEIVRVESDPEENKASSRRKRTATTGAKRKRDGEEEEQDFDEEDWESKVVDGEVGVIRGYVKIYHDPPEEMPGEEELEERELAFSRNRIVTVEVANGDFTFVKTCTEDFFGTGMVEIPPGGIKRTKNSGKMHLVFYIISGKVEVKIGDNEFRVRKGSQFMVPRGNLYSIANPYDSMAKMFFAQGCEKVIGGEGGQDEE